MVCDSSPPKVQATTTPSPRKPPAKHSSQTSPRKQGDNYHPTASSKAGEFKGCILPQSVEASRSRRYFLSLGVLVRQEGPWIEEWVEHYRAEGVEHVYMIDQESIATASEGDERSNFEEYPGILRLGSTSRALLTGGERQDGTGFVTFIPPPPVASVEASAEALRRQEKNRFTHLSIANLPNMERSYRTIVDAAAGSTEWLILLDSDEFMYAASPEATIKSAVEEMSKSNPNAGQICVPWELWARADAQVRNISVHLENGPRDKPKPPQLSKC